MLDNPQAISRDEAKQHVALMSKVLVSPDDLIESTMNDPEMGPQYRDAVRRALLRTVDLACPVEHPLSDADLTKTAEQMVEAITQANETLSRMLIRIMAQAGMSMSRLEPQDLFIVHSDEVIQGSMRGFLSEPTDILHGTFDFLIEVLGSTEEVSRRQQQSLQSLPDAMRSGVLGFALSLTTLVTEVYAGHPDRVLRTRLTPMVLSELASVSRQMVSLPSVFVRENDMKNLLKSSALLLSEELQELVDKVSGNKDDQECDCPAHAPEVKFVYEAPKTVQ